jgi:hypothetical protein
LSGILSWLSNNSEALLATALAVHAAALAIVNLTPNPEKGSKVLATIYKGISFVAGLVTKEARGENEDE